LAFDPDVTVDRTSWRLWPSERVLWHGRAVPRVPAEGMWRAGTALAGGLAAVALLFGALVSLAGLPGAANLYSAGAYMVLLAVGIGLFPRAVLGGGRYVVTDRRVLWRRGRMRRSMDRHAITFGLIRWHRTRPGVGTLELVRAVPFGPLARQQRLVLADVSEPDAVFAIIRGVEPSPRAGDPDVPMMSRLDPGERVLWGGRPEGWLLGWRETATAVLGAAVIVLGMLRGRGLAQVMIGLEEGAVLRIGSWEWVLLFTASVLAWLIMVAVGVGLLWWGLVRARRLGRETDYLLTERRLLIRRGRSELSLDRARIVDVADQPAPRGLRHLFLVLDAPGSRALSVSGALGPILPPRDRVPPVLFELRDSDAVGKLILDRTEGPPVVPRLSDAA
jgi:hypothetical protein